MCKTMNSYIVKSNNNDVRIFNSIRLDCPYLLPKHQKMLKWTNKKPDIYNEMMANNINCFNNTAYLKFI